MGETIHQREIYHGTSKLRIRYLGENDLPSKADNDTTGYSIIGKVYGEEVRQIPPYDVIKRPLTGSNLRVEGLPFQGWLTDSTGTFRIKHLKKDNVFCGQNLLA